METYKSSAGQGLGIAALVLGIISLIVSFIPCIGLFAIVPGIIAIVLSMVAINQANKENAAKGLVIAALVISIMGTTIAILWSIFFATAIQKGSWLRQQIETSIEDESGSSVDDKTRAFGNNMEKILEDLESNVDSLDIKIEFGSKMKDEEFDQFLSSYEKLINESIKLKEKSKTGDIKAIEAYTGISLKLTGLLSKIATSSSKLTREQIKKLENINKKYAKELGSIKND